MKRLVHKSVKLKRNIFLYKLHNFFFYIIKLNLPKSKIYKDYFFLNTTSQNLNFWSQCSIVNTNNNI